MNRTDLFNQCITVVLNNEGNDKIVDHPHDPGGLTRYGIAKKFYPDLDIKNLTRNHAIEIYFRDYWSKMNLQGINDENLILHIFDMGVNAGIRSSIKMVQRLVKAEADGVIGPQTEGLINSYPGDLVSDFKAQRKMYYFSIARRNENLEIFLSGWLNRIDNCKFN